MFGEKFAADLVNGFFARSQIDKWARLILSITATVFTTAMFVFGTAGIAHLKAGDPPLLAAMYALFESCIVASSLALFKWTHSSLTKNIPISVPAALERKEREVLEKESIVTFGKD